MGRLDGRSFHARAPVQRYLPTLRCSASEAPERTRSSSRTTSELMSRCGGWCLTDISGGQKEKLALVGLRIRRPGSYVTLTSS